MELVALPKAQKKRVLIGTTVRKPPEVLQWYLKSLAALQVPDDVEVDYYFVLDMDPQTPSGSMLRAFLHGGEDPGWRWSSGWKRGSLEYSVGPTEDYSDANNTTHHWTGSAMARVAENKNKIIQHALKHRFDYVFFVDADLILEPTTLKSLLSLEIPVACAVYWTRWINDPRIHAAPQVWLHHPYILQGRGYEAEGEFRAKLLSRNATQVWGQGACTLIQRQVLEKGVDFSIIPELPREGMWQGEDRHFCVKCERLHIPMLADPWPDIFHIYHPSQVEVAGEWFASLVEAKRVETPTPLDLVNLKLEALESTMNTPVGPLPVGKIVRGRLGLLKLLPELEEAVGSMKVGEVRVVAAHIGSDYPLPEYRGQRRLFRVTLIDAKPFRMPPVVEDEIYHLNGGAVLDGTTLTPEQHAGVRDGGK